MRLHATRKITDEQHTPLNVSYLLKSLTFTLTIVTLEKQMFSPC
jgi:hypothetical protein